MDHLTDVQIKKFDCRDERTECIGSLYSAEIVLQFGQDKHSRRIKKGLSRKEVQEILVSLTDEVRNGYLNEYK